MKRGWQRLGLPPTAWFCPRCGKLNVSEPHVRDRTCGLCHDAVPLCDRLQCARVGAGLSLGQAAALADLGRRQLNDAEICNRNARLLTVEELTKLAGVYDVPAWVFTKGITT